jgi:RHS repeat-associated protein
VVIDRIAYTPYGEPTRRLRSDVDGNGVVDSRDYEDVIQQLIGTPITSPTYRVEADLDRNGAITLADYDICIADDGRKILGGGGVGETDLFSPGVRNSVGYCGYIHNEDTGLYTVRFRTYSPTLGRWLTRDPLGYVDGMGLYEYAASRSVSFTDPLGLEIFDPLDPARRHRPADDAPTEDNSPVCRTQRGPVVDFESKNIDNPPPGTIKIPRIQDKRERLRKAIEVIRAIRNRLGSCKCFTIGGHGDDGNFQLSGSENNQFVLESNLIDQLIAYRNGTLDPRHRNNGGSDTLKDVQVLDIFFKEIELLVEEGGIVEFAGCNAGGDVKGRELGKRLSLVLPNRIVVLYLHKTLFVDGDIQAFSGNLIWRLSQHYGQIELIPTARKFCKGKEVSPKNPDYDKPSKDGKLKPASGN